MPFKAPESYELDRSVSPSREPFDGSYRYSSDSEFSVVDQFDPLKTSDRPYKDDASQPLRSVFDTDKSATRPLAWLDSQRKRGNWQRWLIPSRFLCVLILVVVALFALLLSAGGIWVYHEAVPKDGESEPWYPSPRGGSLDSWQESYKKAAKLVDQMTLVEKVNISTGTGWAMAMCVGNTGPVDRLGFPSLCLQDGPLGMRFVDNATAFPAGITVGATWNKDLMYERGKAHGYEAKKKGINVLLGPSMGPLGRLKAGGRNWEGFGADPVLQGIAAAQTIKGIQDSGVIATAKHFVGNEQEHFRQSWEWGTPNAISSNIDDRTMHEIYAWPFADSVRAGVASVMCSYNQVNNSYACQNSKLLNGILKDELGFQGFIQSDWLAQRSGVAAALSGLDMSMPGDGLRWKDGKGLWGTELTKAVLNSSVPMERLDDMVLRIAAAWYQLGQDDEKVWPNATNGGGPNFSSWTDDEYGQLHPGSPNSDEKGIVNKFVPVRNTKEGGDHDVLARKVAREGIVMVKNEGQTLPIHRKGSEYASKQGNKKFKIGVFGEDAFANPKGDNACPDRGCNEGTLAMGWGSGAVELPYLVKPIDALRENFDSDTIDLTEVSSNHDSKTKTVASEQDLCIVFVNSDAGEGFISWDSVKGDRDNLYTQKGGDALVQKVAANCGGEDSNGDAAATIVVMHTVGPVILEEWIDLPGVKSVLIAHLPGQESGNALADILFGDVNPSGRLPYTIAKAEKDYGPDSGILYYPNGVVPQQDFKEGLYIDYRHFDKHAITPRYEFGHGLSYTTFTLSSMFIDPQELPGNSIPAPRLKGLDPPKLNHKPPNPTEALWPQGFRRLKKYIYPYIDSVSDIKQGPPYPYPKGYSEGDEPHPLSPAGGGQGGNPDLYTPALKLQATLSNTGSVPGSAVVQLYISLPQTAKSPSGQGNLVDMPVRVLRQFEKVFLKEGERAVVDMELTRRDLSYWDVEMQNWVLPAGRFEVCLGFSSRDLGACDGFDL
jgi:beta-glucosidase